VNKRISAMALGVALLGGTLASRASADELGKHREIKHVLLISVDGLHALDVANYVANHPQSALAELANHGVTYSNARTPANSDSFPGLLALVTGGSPVTGGLFYDVSYNRSISIRAIPAARDNPVTRRSSTRASTSTPVLLLFR